MKPRLLALLTVTFAAGCDRSVSPVIAASREPPPTGAFALELPASAAVAAYSWDDVARVPWLGEQPPDHLQFGELGRSPLTGLYLTFNHEGLENGAQPPGWRVEASGLAAAAGRFGGGARLSEDSVLRCEFPSELRPRAWTIEFWLRPDRLQARELLELPGLLTLRCDRDGLLWLKMPGAGEPGPQGPKAQVLKHPTPLTAGEWHHVGLVLDLVDVRAVRLVLDGQPAGVRIVPARVAEQAAALVVGDWKGDSSGITGALDELRFEARNTSTEELARHWRLERGAVERLRLYPSAEQDAFEELELWREPSTDPRLDSAEEWARGELVHAFGGPAGLTWSAEYWRRLESPDRPVARTTHPVVSLGGQRLLTYGGETRDTHLGRSTNTDDTWIFDGATSRWTRVSSDVAPPPRCHIPAAFSPDHGIVLLVGGWWQASWWSSEPETLLNDTWVFSVEDARWERRFPGGTPLGNVSDHALVYSPEIRRFVLLLGKRAWRYDPEADTWDRPEDFTVVGEAARRILSKGWGSMICARDPATGLVVIFGGAQADPQTFLDTTAFYDPRTNVMTTLELSERPPARVRAGFAHDPVRHRFVLFGGVLDQYSQRFDDLWTFDPVSRRWSEVARGAERPSARGGYYGMAYDEVADRFVLPCGRHSPDRWLDETWALELDERRPGRARYVFDRAAFRGVERWFAELDEPAGSAVRFRFRVGDDGMRFGSWSEECPAEGRFVQVEVTLAPGEGGQAPIVRAMGFR